MFYKTIILCLIKVSNATPEGVRFCEMYKISEFPQILFIHPITGKMVLSRIGFISPENFLELGLYYDYCYYINIF